MQRPCPVWYASAAVTGRDSGFAMCKRAQVTVNRRGIRRFARARLNEAAEPPSGRPSSMREQGWPSIDRRTRSGAVGRAAIDRDLSVRPREGSVW